MHALRINRQKPKKLFLPKSRTLDLRMQKQISPKTNYMNASVARQKTRKLCRKVFERLKE